MNAIIKAAELKVELDAMRPLNPDDEQRIMQKFRLDWNYHSNHIEGNTLTFGETKALLFFGITAQGKPLKDHIEITGHNEAIKTIIEVLEEKRPLTEKFIREIHSLLLKDSYENNALTPDGKPTKKKIRVGEYKSSPNHVLTATGEIFRFSTPEETPSLMHDLIDWYRAEEEKKDVNPVLLAAEFHYKFIRIHPFDDGNGRSARILMNFILMKFGYPPTIIKVEDKENYFAALRQADAGILEPFIEYIAENLVHSLEIMLKGARGESIEEPDDIDKELALLDQKIKSSGKRIDKTKSQENILEVYDEILSKLVIKFIEKSNLLINHYVTFKVALVVDSQLYSGSPNTTVITAARKKMSAKIESLDLRFSFQTFKHAKVEEFNFNSEFDFQFGSARYSIKTPQDSVNIDKLYGEKLSDSQINQLVNIELRRHKEFIEEKLKETEEKR